MPSGATSEQYGVGEIPQILPADLPSSNDLSVLEAMGREYDAESFAFQGLKRRLGIHQETLSRALRRLERDGFVEKVGHSYVVSKKGEALIGRQNGKERKIPASTIEIYSIPILRTILPRNLDLDRVALSLQHRWFGNLRWLGLGKSENNEEHVSLAWVTEDGKMKFTARLSDGSLVIEGYPVTSESLNLAVKSSYQLFDHIMRAISESELKRPASSPTDIRVVRAG